MLPIFFFFFPYFSYVEVMDCKLWKKKWRDHGKKNGELQFD